ncbi:MAG TPA: oligopeptide:H+ symporter, partial [Vicinamibacterales bacterium]
PLIAGYLAQNVDWHVGFACAGVGMSLGLVQYVVGRGRLKHAIARLGQEPNLPTDETTAAQRPANERGGGTSGAAPLDTQTEWKRIAAIVLFFLAAVVFWGAYEQAGSTLNLFADRYTRLSIFGIAFPSSWLQSVQPICVIILAPVFGWLWVRLGRNEPSVPAKFAFGLLFMGLAFAILIPAGAMAQSAAGIRVSPWFLIWAYVVSELGELCISPIGLSAVTKLAPLRIVGLMMGVWFLSNAFGDKLAGSTAEFFSTMPLHDLFREVTIALFITAAVMFVLVRPIKRLMAGVE